MAKKTPKSFATHITTPTGERVYVRGKTKEEFEKKLFQAQVEMQAGVDITSDITFRDYAEVWLKAYKKGKVRPTTYTLHRTNLDLHVLPFFGDMRLKDVRATHVQIFLTSMLGYSKSLQTKCLQQVRSIFQSAEADGLIVKSPVRKDAKVTAPDPAEEQPLTDEQVRALLDALVGTRAYTFCLIALSTGMRRGEILGLMWRDINFKDGIITVSHNKAFPMNDTDAPVTELLKTEAAHRRLPMGQCLTEHLHELKATSDSPYVLSMEGGESLSKSAFRSMWSAVTRRTAGKGRTPRELGATYGEMKVTLDFDVHPHQLRHTYITKLFEKGLDIKQVQYLAGHSRPEMTLRIYTHYCEKQRAAKTHEQVCGALDYLTAGKQEEEVRA